VQSLISAVTVLRPNLNPGHGTVLVLGIPRGGTSVVAGICHMLGVEMGIDIDPSNMEDKIFHQLLMNEHFPEGLADYFADLRRDRKIAGVKNPVIVDFLPTIWSLVPEPILVFVTRDVFAAAQREESTGRDFLETLQAAVQRKYTILDFVRQSDAPLLVITYERLMENPHAAVASLGEFLLGNEANSLIDEIVKLVVPHADMPNDVNFLHAVAANTNNLC
jgi:hypothetical protein